MEIIDSILRFVFAVGCLSTLAFIWYQFYKMYLAEHKAKVALDNAITAALTEKEV